jgi:hypothetical protein
MRAVPGAGRRSLYRWLRRPRHIGVERVLAAFGLCAYHCDRTGIGSVAG